MVAENQKAIYACINLGEACAPKDIEERSVCINEDIGEIRKIDDSFRKIIITRDMVPTYYDEYGILTVNIYDFLLDPKCLDK